MIGPTLDPAMPHEPPRIHTAPLRGYVAICPCSHQAGPAPSTFEALVLHWDHVKALLRPVGRGS